MFSISTVIFFWIKCFIQAPCETQFFADAQSLAAFVSQNQRDKVRQFMEELLAKMLDGPLDDISVGQLSTNENCKCLI